MGSLLGCLARGRGLPGVFLLFWSMGTALGRGVWSWVKGDGFDVGLGLGSSEIGCLRG